LIEATINDEPLNDMDLIAVHFLFAVAGGETTTKLLGNALFLLWKHPEQRKKVTADANLIPGWVEETLRYEASSQMVARRVKQDIELHGKTLKKGDKVALLLASANRDERAFDDPDAYDITREMGQTLAFGHGVHFCLGAHLARLEGIVCLQAVMKRLGDFEIKAHGMVRMHSPNVRGYSSLPIVFTPEVQRARAAGA